MTSPRHAVPDSGVESTGNPILDAANNALTPGDPSAPTALDNNRPSQPSPLKSSTVAADIDPQPTGAGTASHAGAASASSVVPSDSKGVDPNQPTGLENVLSSLGGAVTTAPAAALESISARLPGLVAAAKDSQAGTAVTNTASRVAEQASTYIQQAAAKLPESVTSQLPTQIVGSGNANDGTTGATHHADMKIDSQSRETTSAPVVEAGSQRPQGVLKATVPGAAVESVGQKEKPESVARTDSGDFTKPHTTGIFEASGSLQATHNPSIVEAQTDLATRAENGDL